MQTKTIKVVAFGGLVGLGAFIPLGLYLQWAIPGDGPYEYGVTLLSLLLPLLAIGMRFIPLSSSSVRLAVISAAFSAFFLVQVWLYFPQLSRRVGPWKDLRELLLAKSQQVQLFLDEQGIARDRLLTRQEVASAQSALFDPAPTFYFPLPHRRVEVRIILAEPPYVGVSYGNGRNCVFDLSSMYATYCD